MAGLLLEESLRLAGDGKYDQSMSILDQTDLLAHGDATVHFRKAIVLCAAIRHLLDASNDPTAQRFAATNQLEMNPVVQREIDAGEAKKATTDEMQYKRFRQRARFAKRSVEAMIELHKQARATHIDGLGLPMTVAFSNISSPDEEAHYAAIKTLAVALRPYYPGHDEHAPGNSGAHEQAHTESIVQSCVSIARMQGGLQGLVALLSSKYEQKQWTAAVVLRYVLERDIGCHLSFVSLGGIQALVGVLATHSTSNQVEALQGLRHLAMTQVLQEPGKSVVVLMFEAGTIEAAVRLLSLLAEAADSQADAANLLRAMCENLVEMAEKILMAGGIEALVAVLGYRNSQMQQQQLSDVLVATGTDRAPSSAGDEPTKQFMGLTDAELEPLERSILNTNIEDSNGRQLVASSSTETSQLSLTIVKKPSFLSGPDESCPEAQKCVVLALQSLISESVPACRLAVDVQLVQKLVITLRLGSSVTHKVVLDLLNLVTTFDNERRIKETMSGNKMKSENISSAAEALRSLREFGGVPVLVRLLASDIQIEIEGAARLLTTLASRIGGAVCRPVIKDAGGVQALVTVLRHGQTVYTDASYKQCKLALTALGIDDAAIEREMIVQEMAQVQSIMETTIMQLEAGETPDIQEKAANWLLEFIFNHGARAQRTARKLGLLSIVVECIVHRAGAAPDDMHVFGGLLLVLLNPQLPGETANEAFSRGEEAFARKDFEVAAKSFSAAIVGLHPDLQKCYIMRGQCHAELARPAEAQQDSEYADHEKQHYETESESIVNILLKLPITDNPSLDIYVGIAVSYVFRGISNGADTMVRDAFQKIISLCIEALDEKHPELSVTVGIHLPIRWRHACWVAVHSCVSTAAARGRIGRTVLGEVDSFPRFCLLVGILSAMEEHGKLTGEDLDILKWAFSSLHSREQDRVPVVKTAAQLLRLDANPVEENEVLISEDAASVPSSSNQNHYCSR